MCIAQTLDEPLSPCDPRLAPTVLTEAPSVPANVALVSSRIQVSMSHSIILLCIGK